MQRDSFLPEVSRHSKMYQETTSHTQERRIQSHLAVDYSTQYSGDQWQLLCTMVVKRNFLQLISANEGQRIDLGSRFWPLQLVLGTLAASWDPQRATGTKRQRFQVLFVTGALWSLRGFLTELVFITASNASVKWTKQSFRKLFLCKRFVWGKLDSGSQSLVS